MFSFSSIAVVVVSVSFMSTIITVAVVAAGIIFFTSFRWTFFAMTSAFVFSIFQFLVISIFSTVVAFASRVFRAAVTSFSSLCFSAFFFSLLRRARVLRSTTTMLSFFTLVISVVGFITWMQLWVFITVFGFLFRINIVSGFIWFLCFSAVAAFALIF